MQYAYTSELGGRIRVFIQTPRKTWIALDAWNTPDQRAETERWVKEMGYTLVTFEESFNIK